MELCSENIDLIILNPASCLEWSLALSIFEKERIESKRCMQKDVNVIIMRVLFLLQCSMFDVIDGTNIFLCMSIFILFISLTLPIFLSPSFEAKVVNYYNSFSCPKKWHRLKAKVFFLPSFHSLCLSLSLFVIFIIMHNFCL